MRRMKGANRVLVGKSEGKIPLGRLRLTRENNIKMTRKEKRIRGRRLNLTQDREKGPGVLENKI
jgi:hypothetical protein